MIDSRCHSSRDSSSSAASDSSMYSEPQLKFSKDRDSEEIVDFATVPLTLFGSLTHPKDKSHSFSSPSKKHNRSTPTLVSPFKIRGARQIRDDTKDSPATAYIFTDIENPVERGRPRIRQYANASIIGRVSRSPISPDRFIPVREFIDPPSTPFRVGKSTQRLSPEEKILRRRSARADPFMPTRRRRSASAPRIGSDRIISPHYGPHLINDSSISGRDSRGSRDPLRQVSVGAVWNVGGTSAMLGRRPVRTSGATGGLLASGTTAPMYAAKFLPQAASTEEQEKHESRVALALGIDPASRLLKNSRLWPLLESTPSPSSSGYERFSPFIWKDNAWKKAGKDQWTSAAAKKDCERVVPSRPFRILEAPLLRDDFYCSTLAYSSTSGILAVGLGHCVYLWSEAFGVQYPPLSDQHPSNYVTSLSFSSENGGKSILAVGRQTGMLCLWSPFDSDVRFEINHPNCITCVAFKQTRSRRLSERLHNVEVDAEDLAIGDDLGNIWYYSVEWPDGEIRDEFDWNGAMTLLAKISAHTQQVCGIAWSPDGTYLATGGNDNTCLVFELREIIPPRVVSSSRSSPLHQSFQSLSMQCQNAFSCLTSNANRRVFSRRHLISHLLPSWAHSHIKPLSTSLLNHTGSLISGGERTVLIPSNRQKHRLVHSAAVKAIAFAPWQPSLLATGGGSNDRAIHFYHTPSGSCLATINVYAQVTSLIWSKTRREIVATFGYAQPEHPFRIAVFAWPSCEQIAAIPWGPHGSSWDTVENDALVDCGRALCAVSYPGRSHFFMPDMPDSSDESSASTSATQRGLKRRGRSEPCRRMMGPAAVRPRAKEGGLWCSRTVEEGCIIVASSDQSVKFHEVWSGSRKSAAAACGPYGGSEILEGLEWFEKPGNEIIR